MTHRERREFEIREPYEGYEQSDLQGFAGDVAHEVSNLMDGTVSRLRPEALIYEPGRHGRLTLVAAEYLVLADAWDAANDAPPRLYGRSFEFVSASNRYGLPDFYELHVWHEKSNPNGLLDDWNPRVHC